MGRDGETNAYENRAGEDGKSPERLPGQERAVQLTRARGWLLGGDLVDVTPKRFTRVLP